MCRIHPKIDENGDVQIPDDLSNCYLGETTADQYVSKHCRPNGVTRVVTKYVPFSVKLAQLEKLNFSPNHYNFSINDVAINLSTVSDIPSLFPMLLLPLKTRPPKPRNPLQARQNKVELDAENTATNIQKTDHTTKKKRQKESSNIEAEKENDDNENISIVFTHPPLSTVSPRPSHGGASEGLECYLKDHMESLDYDFDFFLGSSSDGTKIPQMQSSIIESLLFQMDEVICSDEWNEGHTTQI